ncbi:interleukin-8-like [Centroberyx gerrardi]
MCSIIKVLLLLAVMVCISTAQRPEMGQRCLCRRVRNNRFGAVSDIQDVQIYPKSIFCDKVEIVVTFKNNLQYCLDPRMKKLHSLLSGFLKKTSLSPTTRPTESSSSTQSSTDAGN